MNDNKQAALTDANRKALELSRVELSSELREALAEAAKTRATSAILPNGNAVFINYGDQPEDTAHLDCTACGGSGHIEDQKALAQRVACGEPIYFYRIARMNNTTWHETSLENLERIKTTPQHYNYEFRTLYTKGAQNDK